MKIWIAFTLIFFSGYGHAIPQAYKTVANHYGIPQGILYAIALAESGYSHSSQYHPWPWTLNIEGKAYRFSSKASTLAKLNTAIRQQQSVDIGIMQINWRWHKHRFKNVASTLDPYINLRIGAEILREQYHLVHDWWLAVGQYHAPSKDKASIQRAKEYRRRVKTHWRRIYRIHFASKQAEAS